ncbi:MAG TPA: serine--tRNA ligase [Candidatus Methylacidiphilales bacterium]|jgi:seryl-tRNA synthetase|nr:serine--tRNA ligase [Candidatus Methylacidiphilales bacterium]
MLDLRKIRENPDVFREKLARRHGGDEKAIDQILALDEVIRKLKQHGESLKSERNKVSKEVGAIKAKGGDASEIMARTKAMGEEIAQIDKDLAAKETEITDILLRTPNVNHESVPLGTSAEDNRIERVVGQPVELDFTPKPHWEIGAALGMLDFEESTKISGSGFIVFKGKGARLERALINYLLDLHTTQHGYTEVSPPFLVRGESMVGTSQLPKFAEDMYRVNEEPPLYLVPTAEVPVTNLHREEIVDAAKLPIRYAAYTPCFRREAGSAGKDTRGMIRVHQFDKVELVHIVKPEESYATLETLVGHAEQVLKNLGIHYRVVSLCTGDIGFGAAKCYDIEVWAPGVGAWLEVSSCSNFEDFQARRMNLRYKNSEGKNIFCHTLNGSGTALPRLFIALLETFQQADGHVAVPEALRPYLGGLSQL